MRIVRNITAVETWTTENGDIAYAEKDWVCDPWIRGAIDASADGIAMPVERSELSPPLAPTDWTDWGPHRDTQAPPPSEP